MFSTHVLPGGQLPFPTLAQAVWAGIRESRVHDPPASADA